MDRSSQRNVLFVLRIPGVPRGVGRRDMMFARSVRDHTLGREGCERAGQKKGQERATKFSWVFHCRKKGVRVLTLTLRSVPTPNNSENYLLTLPLTRIPKP